MKFFMMILTFSFFLAASLNADEWDVRERNAVEMINEVNKLSQKFSRYQRVVEHLIYQDSGLLNLNEQYFLESAAFIEGMKIGIEGLDFKEINFARAITDIESFYHAHAASLIGLDRLRKRIEQRAEAALGVVEQAERLSQPKHEELQSIVERFDRHLVASRKVTERAKLELATINAELKELWSMTEEVLKSRLRAAMIEQGVAEIDEALRVYDSVMLLETVFRPMLVELQKLETQLESHVLDLAQFQGKNLLTTVESKCSQLLDQVVTSALTERHRDFLLRSTEVTCDASRSHVSFFATLGLSPAELAFEHGQIMASQLETHCKGASTQINCDEFAVLRSILPASLSEMTDQQLAFYETKWTELGEVNQ